MSSEAARDLIKSALARYASIASYRDWGHLQATAGPAAEEVMFESAYVAPSRYTAKFRVRAADKRFRGADAQFTLTCDDARHTIWTKWGDSPAQVHEVPSTDAAIHSIAGISHRAVHFVSRLLMPQLAGDGLANLQDPVLEEDRWTMGTNCACVHGRRPNGESVRAWIGRRDSIVRRLTQASGHIMVAAHLIDVEIADSVFDLPAS